MPQMSPMSWLLIFGFYVSIMYTLLTFSQNIKTKMKNNNTNKSFKKTWLW